MKELRVRWTAGPAASRLQTDQVWTRNTMADSARPWSLELPGRTLLKLVVTAALIWVWLQVWELVLLLLIATVLAIALDPAVSWLERRGWPRGVSSIGIVVALAALLIGFALLAGSSLASEGRL